MKGSRADAQGASFATVTTLFFTWGFITSIIDPLIPSVRAVFRLNYTESMLTQFAFFLAYGVCSLPGGRLVAKIGYAPAILVALLTMMGGCLIFPVATSWDAYGLVLLALFVLAGGITVLQVAANPLAAALGDPQRSHLRLTLSQAFNSLGTVIGPYFGTMVMLRGGLFSAPDRDARPLAGRADSLHHIDQSFLIVAVLILVLAGFIWSFRARLRRVPPPAAAASALLPARSALRSSWAVYGALAIFLYVGAEVSIGSLMINFLHQPDVLGVSLTQAGKLLVLYWLGAMVGRFAGSALLLRVRASRLLAAAALIAALLSAAVCGAGGVLAACAALAIGLFNSIMFPTIFTLTLERSSASTASTSGLLCMAIVGGALLPVCVGLLADRVNIHAAYLIPAVAYLCISAFAVAAGAQPSLQRAFDADRMTH